MATPQTGIFALGTMSHAYLEFDLIGDRRRLVALVAGLREPRTTIGGVNLVAGFRPESWAAIAPDASPPGVAGFDVPLVGVDGFTLPATQHDAVVWLAGAAYDVVFDLSRQVIDAIAPQATLANEVVGWPYHRDLDLTGFIDGTENPPLVEAAQAALIPPGSVGEAGSIFLLQQWEHDGPAWEGLTVDQQEAVIGRRKIDSVELDPKPPTSHVARTDQDRFGTILRRNIAYGTRARHGTIFAGFAARQEVLATMLRSMIGDGDGERDALTRFTHAVSGAYYFVPSAERLAALA